MPTCGGPSLADGRTWPARGATPMPRPSASWPVGPGGLGNRSVRLYSAVMRSVLAAWLLLATTALAARDPALECATQKLAVVGRDARCRLAAHAMALRKGRGPVTKACDSK